jgi:HTH-type transcriptional regulator / antitoxin HigA
MITNEKQYRSTRTQVERLRESLRALDGPNPPNIHPMLVAAQRAAIANQLTELEEDVALFDKLRAGRVSVFEAATLNDLPDILIQARIARGMTQKDLAEFLGLKEQQIQRYEAERYRSASLDRLIEVADALGVKISEKGQLLDNSSLAGR